MGYPLRQYVPGYWYHVTTKGQRGEPLFFSPDDRIKYLNLLDNELDRRGGKIGSFCLMTTHPHLLIKMGPVPLGRILQNVHSSYADYFHETRDTEGHVFQSRPVSKIVLNDAYLWTLVGYQHNNPVEAGVVDDPTDYRWSSWYWFLGERCPWIELTSWEYPPGFDDQNRRAQFEEAVQGEKFDWPGGRVYVGTEDEWENLQRREPGRDAQAYRERRELRPKESIASEVLSETDFTLEDLQGPSRARDVSPVRHEAMARMVEEGYGPSEIGRFLNRTPRAVTKAHEKWSSEDSTQE